MLYVKIQQLNEIIFYTSNITATFPEAKLNNNDSK